MQSGQSAAVQLETCHDLMYQLFVLDAAALFRGAGHGEFLINQQLLYIIGLIRGQIVLLPDQQIAPVNLFHGKRIL